MRIYERTVRSLKARGGERTFWTIGFFCEGFIKKVIVKQTGGPMSDFEVNIYNSIKAARTDSASSGGDQPGGDYAADPETYRVFGPLLGTAGEFMRIDEDWGQGFRNQDGTYTMPVRRIYVQIEIPSNNGQDMTFDVTLGGHTDIG